MKPIALILMPVLLCVNLYTAELSFKDDFKSNIITLIVSTYFQTKGYGVVNAIRYDTLKKNLSVEISPEGELQKLTINVEKINFAADKSANGAKYYIVLNNLTTNRIWLNRMIRDNFNTGIKIPINEQNYIILSSLL